MSVWYIHQIAENILMETIYSEHTFNWLEEFGVFSKYIIYKLFGIESQLDACMIYIWTSQQS